jgi:hypothetical protein
VIFSKDPFKKNYCFRQAVKLPMLDILCIFLPVYSYLIFNLFGLLVDLYDLILGIWKSLKNLIFES